MKEDWNLIKKTPCMPYIVEGDSILELDVIFSVVLANVFFFSIAFNNIAMESTKKPYWNYSGKLYWKLEKEILL